MNSIPDGSERKRALDPRQSFIVQAPAGSGKTELLTQRYLVLLATVKQPEEILSITFTKKAAAEMRARIIKALMHAQSETEPDNAHAKQTYHLAKTVLKQSELHQWNLLTNPNRLRIQTIDSFNVYLTKQLPILSHFGSPPDITDKPHKLYTQAVAEFLSHLDDHVEWADAIAHLLIHMDNDIIKLQQLLVNMLAKRDQWLFYIIRPVEQITLKRELESHLSLLSEEILTKLKRYFPKNLISDLVTSARFAGENLARDNSPSFIAACASLSDLPDTSLADKSMWLALGELLLTKESLWRKRLDKNMGFPSPSSSKNASEKNRYTELKALMQSVINELSDHEELRIAFVELASAPHHEYQESQWETLKALQQVLTIAYAQLKLLFQEEGKIDYIENAIGALTSLGSEDDPTDITLALDYQIKHLLIDEFQDTSTSQYRLIEKLTAGWQPQDGRTLFVVGDPMQSIYRFREAEVGLFIRARQSGIAHIPCEPLTLTVNFRSVSGVVNWINHHFKTVFPRFNDIAMGAVSYSPSIAKDQSESENAVTLHPLLNGTDEIEASKIVELIRALKSEAPTDTIAILVRSRSHLKKIILQLKQSNINYKAIDIDSLDSRPIIQDLISLTSALTDPTNRIAWLSLLRAPWTGLTLVDLHTLANKHPASLLWEVLDSPAINQLSLDGQERLKRILPILKTKMADRNRYPLRNWIEHTWMLLGGPACTSDRSELDDARAFFGLLEKFEHSSHLLDMDELQRDVSQLFATPNHSADSTLQIMTIHNAKGLEFDTVILPHLERKSPSDDKQILLWMERTREDASNSLLLAPIHAVGEAPDTIYEYIKRQNAIKTDYEIARLLYVAATRAKKQLHCFFSLEQNDANTILKPPSKSLLEKLWDSLEHDIISQTRKSESNLNNDVAHLPSPSLNRLSLQWTNPLNESTLTNSITYHNKRFGFLLPNENPKKIGTLIHKLLDSCTQQGVSWWSQKSWAEKEDYLAYQLKSVGIFGKDNKDAIISIGQQIDNMINDERGLWILSSHHEAQSEFKLTSFFDNQIQSISIDRTFVDDNNIRWIIDYKTGSPLDESLDDFIQKEEQKYSKQMLHYHDVIRKIDTRPIRLALYFTALSLFKELKAPTVLSREGADLYT